MSAPASAWPLAARTRAARRVLSAWATWAAVWGLRAAARGLPERWLLAAARAVGGVFSNVLRFRRAVVSRRLALALGRPEGAPELQREGRHAYALAALSLLWFLRLDADQDLGRLVDADADARAWLAACDAAPRHGRHARAVIVTGHVGCWELLPAALGSLMTADATQWIVYRPLHHDALDAMVADARAAPNRKLIPDKRCFNVLRDALTLPESSGAQIVGLVSDQRASANGATVDFLGQPTRFPTGAARLHMATDASLWFAALLHNERFYETTDPDEKPFRLILRRIPTQQSTGRNGGPTGTVDAAAIMQSYASILESVVRDHPAQYMWFHDLWRDNKPAVAIQVD